MSRATLTEARNRQIGTPLRVLLVEHDPNDAGLLLAELENSGFRVSHEIVENREQFLAQLEKGPFDAILADYRLPDWSGLEALKELRASGKDIPFLLVSRTLGEEEAVECIKQGVHDYIMKGHMSRLPTALR